MTSLLYGKWNREVSESRGEAGGGLYFYFLFKEKKKLLGLEHARARYVGKHAGMRSSRPGVPHFWSRALERVWKTGMTKQVKRLKEVLSQNERKGALSLI